jgi:hypothetical protein
MNHPAVLAHEREILARLGTCQGPYLDLAGLADLIYGDLGFDGRRQGAEERILEDMHRRRSSFSAHGNPIDFVARVLSSMGGGVSGAFWNDEQDTAAISIRGAGFAVAVISRRPQGDAHYGVVHDYGGRLLLHTCAHAEVRAFRKTHVPSFNANTTAKSVLASTLAGCHGNAALAALTQFTHRHMFTGKGAGVRVIHDLGHETVDAERWRMQALLGTYLRELFKDEAIRPEDKLGGKLGQMRLDYFIPGKRLAVEYDGVQHDKPVDFSGHRTEHQRKQELAERQRRDAVKHAVCAAHGVTIVRFSYRDTLTLALVRDRLATAGFIAAPA